MFARLGNHDRGYIIEEKLEGKRKKGRPRIASPAT